MDLPAIVIPYTRSTEYTTAPSSLLMILHHFKPEFALSRENEFDIWRASVNLPTRASSIFGLAVFAKQHGLNPRIVIESKDYEYPDYRFKRYKKLDIDYAGFASDQHRVNAERLRIPIEERDLPFEEMVDLVKKGRVLMVRLNSGVFRGKRSTSKYVVLCGYKAGMFTVMDPVLDKPQLEVSEEQLKEAYDTLATKKKRDHRMVVF